MVFYLEFPLHIPAEVLVLSAVLLFCRCRIIFLSESSLCTSFCFTVKWCLWLTPMYFFYFPYLSQVLPMIPLGILQAVAKLASSLLNVQQGDVNTPISHYQLPLKVPNSLKCKVLCFVGQTFHWTLCRGAEAVKCANSVQWKPALLYFYMSLEFSHLNFCIFLALSVWLSPVLLY